MTSCTTPVARARTDRRSRTDRQAQTMTSSRADRARDLDVVFADRRLASRTGIVPSPGASFHVRFPEINDATEQPGVARPAGCRLPDPSGE